MPYQPTMFRRGGATWWGEYYVNCNNVYVNNSIRYTRVATDMTGQTWSPKRGAIMIGNKNTNLHIESHAVMAANSVGYGFVVNTTIGPHEFKFSGSMLNSGDSSNVAIYLIRPVYAQISGVQAKGFAKLCDATIGVEPTSGNFPVINIDNSIHEGNGTAPAFTTNYGTGGTLAINGGRFTGNGIAAVVTANLHNVHISSLHADGSTYFCDFSGTSRAISLNNMVNVSDKFLAVRINSSLANDIGDIEYHSFGHVGVACNHRYQLATLTTVGSRLNQYGKYKGRMVPVGLGGGFYIASGANPADAWFPLSVGSAVTPA